MAGDKSSAQLATSTDGNDELPTYQGAEQSTIHNHTNAVIEAANVRARDEVNKETRLQTPEFCSHRTAREKAYDNLYYTQATMFPSNPYRSKVISPIYGRNAFKGRDKNEKLWQSRIPPRADPAYYTQYLQEMIELNAALNEKAQSDIDAREPAMNIWEVDDLAKTASTLALQRRAQNTDISQDSARPTEGRALQNKQQAPATGPVNGNRRQSWLKKAFSGKTPEEKEAKRLGKLSASFGTLRNSILQEEQGRWPTQEWRRIVEEYQNKVGMKEKIAELRYRHPIQYLHLLRAGYFEPIPVAWADQVSNPLKFKIESMEGWRGITPTWRGFEDTAEERLYWVLNHRSGPDGQLLKPDVMSAVEMARQRMASAVEPPPQYFSATDTCHTHHSTEGYSNQVIPASFHAFDARETSADDTMILLDVSESMGSDLMRPDYEQYLITSYSRSTQPKNKGFCTDVAKAIIRRFVGAMINHSHNGRGYQLTTFANHASYMGVINHHNFEDVWGNVVFGGGTRVMTGWQRAKRLHFEKHRESATLHPVYGWQAGPKTPMLRLLLLLDGEAMDMDQFELDLLANSWAHVTIFLLGVDGCLSHHRHANELQRVSEVNHHVSFIDAQGNMPERLVTHELLKRHLGYEVSMAEFVELEQPPAYDTL
ncbi:hypothetical protein NLG97_g5483 [Lecanicillium saksenae]|uniref:Uncharacterized protein n=1 Tax=Lecanicillium saksenae TaxID=468837 RepID=A0ACC1QSW1_9HYPO|nr:hypothetical protein NLG97_g5483 [Lecanicillium saksenae]